jgi:hypothetical protein
MGNMGWEQTAVIVGVLSPLVGVPLGVIGLYLKAIRDHQTTAMAELTHRIEAMETSMRDLLRRSADFEREYATKEEWVRESMLARQQLERLTEMIARIQAELETGQSLSMEIGRATATLVTAIKENGSAVKGDGEEAL